MMEEVEERRGLAATKKGTCEKGKETRGGGGPGRGARGGGDEITCKKDSAPRRLGERKH